MNPAHAVYAALSWSFLALAGVFLVGAVVKPKRHDPLYFSFLFKGALICGAVVGLLALAIGSDYFWRIP